MKEDVQMIPIERIRILNPRARNPEKFELIVQSIKNLGLKKPIQVSLRAASEEEGPGYDLVCGQGRIEAFIALGHKEIPAIVVEVSKHERLLRSLVENMARRFPKPFALLHEIERLKTLGYPTGEIARKLDLADCYVSGFLALHKAGEERLLDAVLTGRITVTTAIEIARADTPQVQRELLKAYEAKQLNFDSIRVVKRLIDQRRFVGKRRYRDKNRNRRHLTSVESMVSAFRRESQKQKLTVKKARICEARVSFIVAAFNKLLADENFVTLLRAEGLMTMPKCLWEKLQRSEEAA